MCWMHLKPSALIIRSRIQLRERVPDHWAGKWKSTTAIIDKVSITTNLLPCIDIGGQEEPGCHSVLRFKLPIQFSRLEYKWLSKSSRLHVRTYVIAGRGPAYSGPQRWDLYVGPMCQPRERRGIGRYVRCMCQLCRVEEGLSRREQLVRYF